MPRISSTRRVKKKKHESRQKTIAIRNRLYTRICLQILVENITKPMLDYTNVQHYIQYFIIV